MRILAIDPGSTQSAYVVYGVGGKRIINASILDNKELTKRLKGGIYSDCHTLVGEMIASFGMAVGDSVFQTAFWLGVFVGAWDGPYALVKRHEVKMHLCHSMRAKDGNIRQALIDRFGPLPTKKAPNGNYPKRIAKDEWSALAVAVTWADAEEGE